MQLIWSQPARRDLFAIAAYFRTIDPGLEAEILDRIDEGPRPLLEFPEIGSPTRRRGVRKWAIRRTPYLLFYAVRSNRLEIRRVVHNSTDWARY